MACIRYSSIASSQRILVRRWASCISESQVEVDPAEEIAKRDAEAAANYELAMERAKELGNGDDAPGQDDDKTDEDGDLNGTARP